MVFEIERKLAEDGARPLIFYDRRATCWRPQVKGLTIMVNSIFNRGRMEDCLVGEVDRRVAASGVREAGAVACPLLSPLSSVLWFGSRAGDKSPRQI